MLFRSKSSSFFFVHAIALVAALVCSPVCYSAPNTATPTNVTTSTASTSAVTTAPTPTTPDSTAASVPAPAPTPAAETINSGYSGTANDPSKPVAVHILSPKPDEIITTSTVDVFFSVDNYTLADGGNRLHVILNNNDPVPVYDLRRPLTFKELPEGGHTVRVLVVQPDGHSLPNPEAFAIVHFFVRKKNFQNYIAPNSPFLTVNLPVSGIVDIEDGGKVWFDFHVHRAQLSPKGYKVHYKINNIEGNITEDKPVYWEGMKPGRYELAAELLDSNNIPAQGIFNQVKRSFDVRAVVKALPAEPETPAANHNTSHP
jgi:hypothetical protein